MNPQKIPKALNFAKVTKFRQICAHCFAVVLAKKNRFDFLHNGDSI